MKIASANGCWNWRRGGLSFRTSRVDQINGRGGDEDENDNDDDDVNQIKLI